MTKASESNTKEPTPIERVAKPVTPEVTPNTHAKTHAPEVLARKAKGVPLKRLVGFMATAMISISLLVLICIIYNFSAYKSIRQASEDYVTWQQAAQDMQLASDYLTEQVRSYAETGVRRHLDSYFHEATQTRRREAALTTMRQLFPESTISNALASAMDKSVALMDIEYYSMRLKLESMHEDITQYPEALQTIVLTPEDNALSDEAKAVKAREILFDNTYLTAKDNISQSISLCINSLTTEMKTRQDAESNRLNSSLIVSLVLVLAFLGVSIALILLTSQQVFRPLIYSIPHIERNDPIPVTGAYEFRILAETYNAMREANSRSKDRLRYKANHDPLTGVLNRRGFDQLRNDIEADGVALLIADVDNFKHVNDTYGHTIGDRILVSMAGILKESFRTEDHICRMGGDEFAVVMLNVKPEQKAVIRQKIDDINGLLLSIKGDLPAVTLSVGVAFGNAIDDSVCIHADDALYRTKQSGKCGCTFYEE